MRLAVQVVGNRIGRYFDKAWKAGEERYSRIVIIGFADMDKNEIGKILSF
jgi:cobalamin biosynthesis protein CobW